MYLLALDYKISFESLGIFIPAAIDLELCLKTHFYSYSNYRLKTLLVLDKVLVEG